MDIFKPLISEKEANELRKSEVFTWEMKYMFDSFTFPHTLADFIGDFKQNELNEVYYLESKNLFHFINSVSMVLRRRLNKDICDVFYDTKEVKELIAYSHTLEYEPEVRIKILFTFLVRHMLSILTSKSPGFSEVKFYGEVPKKMFSLRQTKANIWFDKYIEFVLFYASNILTKTNDDDIAYHYVLSNTVWYLNKSQPFKYYSKSSDKDFNETISRLYTEFAETMGEDKAYFNTNKDAPLFKDL